MMVPPSKDIYYYVSEDNRVPCVESMMVPPSKDIYYYVSEDNRVPCVESMMVPPLVEMLTSDNVHAAIQACRALGNICFDNGM